MSLQYNSKNNKQHQPSRLSPKNRHRWLSDGPGDPLYDYHSFEEIQEGLDVAADRMLHEEALVYNRHFSFSYFKRLCLEYDSCATLFLPPFNERFEHLHQPSKAEIDKLFGSTMISVRNYFSVKSPKRQSSTDNHSKTQPQPESKKNRMQKRRESVPKKDKLQHEIPHPFRESPHPLDTVLYLAKSDGCILSTIAAALNNSLYAPEFMFKYLKVHGKRVSSMEFASLLRRIKSEADILGRSSKTSVSSSQSQVSNRKRGPMETKKQTPFDISSSNSFKEISSKPSSSSSSSATLSTSKLHTNKKVSHPSTPITKLAKHTEPSVNPIKQAGKESVSLVTKPKHASLTNISSGKISAPNTICAPISTGAQKTLTSIFDNITSPKQLSQPSPSSPAQFQSKSPSKSETPTGGKSLFGEACLTLRNSSVSQAPISNRPTPPWATSSGTSSAKSSFRGHSAPFAFSSRTSMEGSPSCPCPLHSHETDAGVSPPRVHSISPSSEIGRRFLSESSLRSGEFLCNPVQRAEPASTTATEKLASELDSHLDSSIAQSSQKFAVHSSQVFDAGGSPSTLQNCDAGVATGQPLRKIVPVTGLPPDALSCLQRSVNARSSFGIDFRRSKGGKPCAMWGSQLVSTSAHIAASSKIQQNPVNAIRTDSENSGSGSLPLSGQSACTGAKKEAVPILSDEVDVSENIPSEGASVKAVQDDCALEATIRDSICASQTEQAMGTAMMLRQSVSNASLAHCGGSSDSLSKNQGSITSRSVQCIGITNTNSNHVPSASLLVQGNEASGKSRNVKMAPAAPEQSSSLPWTPDCTDDDNSLQAQSSSTVSEQIGSSVACSKPIPSKTGPALTVTGGPQQRVPSAASTQTAKSTGPSQISSISTRSGQVVKPNNSLHSSADKMPSKTSCDGGSRRYQFRLFPLPPWSAELLGTDSGKKDCDLDTKDRNDMTFKATINEKGEHQTNLHTEKSDSSKDSDGLINGRSIVKRIPNGKQTNCSSLQTSHGKESKLCDVMGRYSFDAVLDINTPKLGDEARKIRNQKKKLRKKMRKLVTGQGIMPASRKENQVQSGEGVLLSESGSEHESFPDDSTRTLSAMDEDTESERMIIVQDSEFPGEDELSIVNVNSAGIESSGGSTKNANNGDATTISEKDVLLDDETLQNTTCGTDKLMSVWRTQVEPKKSTALGEASGQQHEGPSTTSICSDVTCWPSEDAAPVVEVGGVTALKSAWKKYSTGSGIGGVSSSPVRTCGDDVEMTETDETGCTHETTCTTKMNADENVCIDAKDKKAMKTRGQGKQGKASGANKRVRSGETQLENSLKAVLMFSSDEATCAVKQIKGFLRSCQTAAGQEHVRAMVSWLEGLEKGDKGDKEIEAGRHELGVGTMGAAVMRKERRSEEEDLFLPPIPVMAEHGVDVPVIRKSKTRGGGRGKGGQGRAGASKVNGRDGKGGKEEGAGVGGMNDDADEERMLATRVKMLMSVARLSMRMCKSS